MERDIYIYIYIYAVKLKSGPRFAFLKVKTGPICCFCFLLFIFEHLILPTERRGFLKKNKQTKTTKETHVYKLKTGPIMLHNILGPIFNLYLDQFLTYKICYFFGLFGLKTLFYSVFSKKCKKKKKNTKK